MCYLFLKTRNRIKFLLKIWIISVLIFQNQPRVHRHLDKFVEVAHS